MKKVFLLLAQVIHFLAPQLKKADSKVGIKETKEALIGINEVSLNIAGKLKDGVQFEDFTQFYADLTTNEEFKAKVQAAYENYQAIPEEVEDMDAGEGLELAGVQLDYTPKFIDLFSKDAK